MLYKHLFSILCGHLNLNQKRKKLNLTGFQSNRPVYRYEPVELSFLNSNLNLTGFYRFPAKPVRYTGIGPRRFDRTGRLIKPWRPLAKSLSPRFLWSPGPGRTGVCMMDHLHGIQGTIVYLSAQIKVISCLFLFLPCCSRST